MQPAIDTAADNSASNTCIFTVIREKHWNTGTCGKQKEERWMKGGSAKRVHIHRRPYPLHRRAHRCWTAGRRVQLKLAWNGRRSQIRWRMAPRESAGAVEWHSRRRPGKPSQLLLQAHLPCLRMGGRAQQQNKPVLFTRRTS